MTLQRPSFLTSGFLLCILWVLVCGSLPAAARHHRYINKHTVSTTRVVAAGVTVLRGRASWYGVQFQGSPTTSGERFDRFKYTCAHRTLPFGTRLRVTNIKSHRSVVVRVSDRGPFRHQRIIDLAEIAARPLGIVDLGAAPVIAEVVAATTPLGPTTAPANLLALLAADPDPSAAHATYPAPPVAEMLAETAPPVPAAATTLALAMAAALAAAPAALTAAPARPSFVLQAGAFADLENARAVQAHIQALHPELSVVLATEMVAGRELNRVVIDQLDSWLAAETVRRNLQLAGITGLVRQLPAEHQEPVALVATTETAAPLK